RLTPGYVPNSQKKMMEEFEAQLHRTWLSLLVDGNLREAASLVVDADLTLIHGNFTAYGLSVDLPPSARIYVESDASLKQILEQTLKMVAKGHFYDQNGDALDDIRVEFRVKLLDVEENWKEIIREQIVNAKNSNQGLISEKVFSRKGKQLFVYNEMKFASQSEIRIAQELEQRR